MYRKKRIDSSNISDYENLIPKSYVEMIRSGKLSAGLILDPSKEQEQILLVYVTAVRSDWLELVWLDVFDRSRVDSFYAGLFRTLIREDCLWREEPLKGVYAEFYMDMRFQADRIRNVMIMAGMKSSITKGNVYEFTLRDVKGKGTFQKAVGKMPCISFSQAGPELYDKLDAMLQDDARPSPLPQFVNWDLYLPEVSMVCMREENPCGILLFTERMDAIVIDCAFVTDELAFACLLGHAYEKLIGQYGEDQRILVPVVVDRTASIVERLVPAAERTDVVEAVMWL